MLKREWFKAVTLLVPFIVGCCVLYARLVALEIQVERLEGKVDNVLDHFGLIARE